MKRGGGEQQKRKLRVGVIFDGRSVEHEVSIISARNIIAALDPKKYDILPIGITKEGRWITGSSAMSILKEGRGRTPSFEEKVMTPDPTKKGLVSLTKHRQNQSGEVDQLDVIIPVLHGIYGEDGTIQGLLELSGIPYVGSGVLGSALGMDKIAMKKLFREAELPVVPFLPFLRKEWKENPKRTLASIRSMLKFPQAHRSPHCSCSRTVSRPRIFHHFIRAEKEVASS